MNINDFDMWHSCSYLIMLQNSFLCDNATNFLTSQWYAHRLVITIWRTIAPWCDIRGYSDVRMWQTFPKCDKHFKHYMPHYNDQFPNVAIVKDGSTLCQVFPNIALWWTFPYVAFWWTFPNVAMWRPFPYVTLCRTFPIITMWRAFPFCYQCP